MYVCVLFRLWYTEQIFGHRRVNEASQWFFFSMFVTLDKTRFILCHTTVSHQKCISTNSQHVVDMLWACRSLLIMNQVWEGELNDLWLNNTSYTPILLIKNSRFSIEVWKSVLFSWDMEQSIECRHIKCKWCCYVSIETYSCTRK